MDFLLIFNQILDHFWVDFGSQNGSKINQKSIQNLINFFIDFWIDFLMKFEGFGKQKQLKNAGGVSNFESFWFLVEHQFLINF